MWFMTSNLAIHSTIMKINSQLTHSLSTFVSDACSIILVLFLLTVLPRSFCSKGDQQPRDKLSIF